MSTRTLAVKRGWISFNAPCKNGVGRFIPQLMRVTIKFCKDKPNSLGVRHFIQSDIVNFAEANPNVAIYLKPRRYRQPVIIAEYLNGEKHRHSLIKHSPDEVRAWMDLFASHSGKEYQVQSKWSYSDNPSVQGTWDHFTHQNPKHASAKYPLQPEDIKSPVDVYQSVTEELSDKSRESS